MYGHIRMPFFSPGQTHTHTQTTVTTTDIARQISYQGNTYECCHSYSGASIAGLAYWSTSAEVHLRKEEGEVASSQTD